MSDFAVAKGARAAEGTDMARLSQAVCERFKLSCKVSNDINALIAAVSDGAMAICNVSGDRTGHKGVFSTGGHFVVCIGAGAGIVTLYDPGIYAEKYDTAWRKAKVSAWGNALVSDAITLDEDCAGRTPKYYIFRQV